MSEQVPPSSWPEVWTRPHLSKGRTLLWEDQDMPHMGTGMKGVIIRWVPPRCSSVSSSGKMGMISSSIRALALSVEYMMGLP